MPPIVPTVNALILSNEVYFKRTNELLDRSSLLLVALMLINPPIAFVEIAPTVRIDEELPKLILAKLIVALPANVSEEERVRDPRDASASVVVSPAVMIPFAATVTGPLMVPFPVKTAESPTEIAELAKVPLTRSVPLLIVVLPA